MNGQNPEDCSPMPRSKLVKIPPTRTLLGASPQLSMCNVHCVHAELECPNAGKGHTASPSIPFDHFWAAPDAWSRHRIGVAGPCSSVVAHGNRRLSLLQTKDSSCCLATCQNSLNLDLSHALLRHSCKSACGTLTCAACSSGHQLACHMYMTCRARCMRGTELAVTGTMHTRRAALQSMQPSVHLPRNSTNTLSTHSFAAQRHAW